MSVVVKQVELRQVPVRTRFPFRYGIATLTEVPYLIVMVECVVKGKMSRGFAADVLPPKWFTKQPEASFDEELSDMQLVIRRAAVLAVEIGMQPSVYRWWRELYTQQLSDGAIKSFPPLLKALGVSLLERAVIDASCRIFKATFHASLQANLFDVRLSEFHSELGDLSPADLLRREPESSIAVRHTVGLGDPLTARDTPREDRVEDGLPHALDECIARYGLTHFKIKTPADVKVARKRLTAISRILQELTPSSRFTLDGNEFFERADEFVSFWAELNSDPSVRRFFARGLLLVEQPIHRDAALNSCTVQEFARWRERPPIIIDESDAEIGSFERALHVGYDGTSHKNCKGVFKGLANACLVHWRNAQQPQRQLQITGEDLMNIGPIALLQDLAVGASLGFSHMERNGHHYVAGLQPFPESVRKQVSLHHRDLYATANDDAGETWPHLNIENGQIRLDSVNQAPFGYSISIRPEDFELLSCN